MGRGFGSVPARMDLVLRVERPVVGAAGLLWAGTAVCGLGPLWRMRSQQQEALEGGRTITERTQPGARRLLLGNRTSRKEEGPGPRSDRLGVRAGLRTAVGTGT